MTELTAAMRIAADIIRGNPEIGENKKLLRDLLSGLRNAIMQERAACQAEAERLYNGETANRPEFTDVEVAVKFTMKCVSATIADAIADREAP